MKLYKVRNWDSIYENNRTRDLEYLDWLPLPNSFDGDSYTYLWEQRKSVTYWAAWVLILEVASTCTPRGWLVRKNGKPHTPESLARKTNAPARIFEESLPFLASHDMQWLEVEGTEDVSPDCENVRDSRKALRTTERNGTEQNGTEGNGIFSSTPKELFGLELYQNDKTLLVNWESQMTAWRQAFPYLDIEAEIRKAHAWEMANPKKRKKAKRRFLMNWFLRADHGRAVREPANYSGSGGTIEDRVKEKQARRKS